MLLESLPFLFCVVVLAATGAATVRVMLPDAQHFQEDKAKLEVLAWSFAACATALLGVIALLGQTPLI